jgi:amino acid adenylation domain-containing protein
VTQLLQNWISQQAQRRPEAVAVVMEGQSLTYGQLEESTNRLARLLQAAGCRRGDRVCFAIPKSPAAIIAIVGILKADCVHVPIDTTSPAARVSKIIRSSAPRYILGVESSSGLLEELFEPAEFRESVGVGWMEKLSAEHRNFRPKFQWADINGYSAEPLQTSQHSDDPAHILFTSGSTGEPKGVVITHANVIHFVEWATRYFGIHESDRVSGHPPLHFDLSVFDIFGAFAAGAELHLVPPKVALLPNKLADFIRDSELTQWFSVPSVLNYLAKFDVVKANDFPALRRLLWCGEVFPTPALIYWMKRLPHVSFTNLYGPTETTIASSYYTVKSCPADGTQAIPIGTACGGEELLVLDKDLRRAPAGEVGNLYIRGVGLSPGYWCNPAATEAAFVPYGEGDRIYRTGDLARVGQDGLVYFVGRADTQIKSRGYRIELGEIEVALHDLPELKECAVVALPTDGFETNLICCAYVGRDKNVTPPDIRVQLGKVLPPYMVPSRWLVLPQLPKNANGKIDRRKVQELFAIELRPTRAAAPGPDRDSDPSSDSSESLQMGDAMPGSSQPMVVLGSR